MAKFFIKRPVFAIVLSIFIILAGVIAIFNLPIAQYPQISPPRISVNTNYSGANAEVVEQSIAQLIEQQVNGAEGMIDMRSTSSDNGRYSLDVVFELGKDADLASVEVQNRVAQANSQLPQEVLQSGIITHKTSPDTVMYFSLWSPNGTYDNIFLKNYGSINIVDELKRIKGVGEVSEYGPDFGMRIWLEPDKMARLGVTSNDIYNAIKAQNVQAPAGSIGQLPSLPEQQFQYTARVKGRLTDAEEFGKIIVKSKSDGSFIRLSDVAKINFAGKDYTFTSDINGKESVTFAIQLTSDANALETVAKAQEVIAAAAQRFPADMTYKVVTDNTRFVRASLGEVAKTFVEAILLVLLIVFLFLQSWRATLIPMLAVPVSIIGTFGAFLVMGFSINTLTLFAMVLAIGLVVDDAIVVVEAVEHHMRYSGLPPREATERAMEEVSGPVIAIAFVLASVFIPVAFFGGTMGVLYKQFALTISVSMALSAIVALSLTPALCTLLLKPYNPDGHKGFTAKVFARFNDWFERVTGSYTLWVQKAIKKAGVVIACLLIIIVLTGTLFKLLPSSFVPNEDQGFYLLTVNLPEAASMNRTRQVANQVGDIVRSQPGVEDVLVIAGFDMLVGSPKPNSAIVVAALKPWEERKEQALQLDRQIRNAMVKTKDISEAIVMAFSPPSLPGVGNVGGISMMLQDRSGGSIEEMDKVSKQFIAEARKRPEVGNVYTTFRSDTPGYRFDVDREKAEKLGVPVCDVFSTLQTFLGGLQVNDINRFGRTYKVVMQAEPQYRADVDATRFFFVRSKNGDMVPLNTLVKAVPINAPSAIKRFNGFRTIQIGGTAAPGYSSGQLMAALEEVAAQTLPSSYSYDWADQSREEKLSAGRAPIVFGFALLFVFLCLAALYESWSVPFAVLFSVPTGIFGCALFQYLAHLENSVYMQIGLVMLIGLAAKNAILIVEFAKVRVDKGMDAAQAAIEAAKLRLRPILMTSLAFIIGCLPLMFAQGAGAGARNAMGTAVVGGMFTATIIGVVMIPVLFVVIEKLKARFKSNKSQVA